MANVKIWLIVLIAVMGFLLFYLYDFMQSESYECLKAPVVYGINRIGQDVECFCTNDRIMQEDYFKINNTDLWAVKKQKVSPIPFTVP